MVDACRTVFDPDVRVNILDMGLIYAIDISTNGIATTLMTLTSTTPDRITRALRCPKL